MKLAIISLGHRNAGKSNTWYEIFGRVVRSGFKRLQLDSEEIKLLLKNSSFEETDVKIENYLNVFLQNASFEENGGEISAWFNENDLPDIFLCSVQYSPHGIETINWLKENGYFLYIQWLNPGYFENEYADTLEFEKLFKEFGRFIKSSGKEKTQRVLQIKRFLNEWVLKRVSAQSA